MYRMKKLTSAAVCGDVSGDIDRDSDVLHGSTAPASSSISCNESGAAGLPQPLTLSESGRAAAVVAMDGCSRIVDVPCTRCQSRPVRILAMTGAATYYECVLCGERWGVERNNGCVDPVGRPGRRKTDPAKSRQA